MYFIMDVLQPTEHATMSELESYLESLYDDLQAKIRGTGLILQLARTPDNLFELAENGRSPYHSFCANFSSVINVVLGRGFVGFSFSFLSERPYIHVST